MDLMTLFSLISGGASIASFLGDAGKSVFKFVKKQCILRGKATEVSCPDQNLKEELAIVLEISRPIESYINKFIQKKNGDVSIIYIRLKDNNRFIDVNNKKQWRNIMDEYSLLISSIIEKHPPKCFHLFFSAPAALTYGIGCQMGCLYKSTIYHYVNENPFYVPVLTIDSRIKK